MSRPFSKDEGQMANKYRKQMFRIPNPQGNASCNHADSNLTPVRRAIIKNKKTNAAEDMGKWGFCSLLVGVETNAATVEISMKFLFKKLKN